ncbi:MAG: CysS/YqeB C-terminal domain-containing protein, partial [Planctomycetota bacterium]
QFFEQRQARLLKRKGIDTALVESLIAERVQARQEKDWAKADRIRDELSAMDILIEDRADGTIWKVI